MYKNNLSSFGLSERESQIYMLCLEYGILQTSKIAHKLGIHRTTCYDSIQALVQKGVLVETFWKGIKQYEAVSPEILLQGLAEKYDHFKTYIPELLSLRNRFGVRPKIKVFEGLENVKQMYADMLSYQGTIIKAILGFDIINETFLQRRDTYFIQQRVEKNINIKVISTQNTLTDKYHQHDHDCLRETRYLKNIQQELGCGWFIYAETKCLLIIYDNKDISGIIIESKSIYDLSEIIFDTLRGQLV